jgi:hypothetical protein
MPPPVTGDDDGTGFGVKGSSASPHIGKGVEGISTGDVGVLGQTRARNVAGVHGVNTGHTNAIGVIGEVGRSGPAAVKGVLAGGSGMGGGNDTFGCGVWGDSSDGPGVTGTSSGNAGVVAIGTTEGLRATCGNGPAVSAESTNREGVRGTTHSPLGAVVGMNDGMPAREKGPEYTAAGVFGTSQAGEGVVGQSNAKEFYAAVSGVTLNERGIGPGVMGDTRRSEGPGVLGRSARDAAVMGLKGDPALGESTVQNDASFVGVFGASEDGAGVLGYARRHDSPGVYAWGGLKALALGHPFAGEFVGGVQVSGDVELKAGLQVDGDILLPGADCAESFTAADDQEIEAGSVVVIVDEGRLRESTEPYDRRVAGVVSGAGDYRPGIILDSQREGHLPVALIGKVYCKVDASFGSISVGDLLTTCATPGHAMRAADSHRSVGAMIGKALAEWRSGKGLIPILLTLG